MYQVRYITVATITVMPAIAMLAIAETEQPPRPVPVTTVGEKHYSQQENMYHNMYTQLTIKKSGISYQGTSIAAHSTRAQWKNINFKAMRFTRYHIAGFDIQIAITVTSILFLSEQCYYCVVFSATHLLYLNTHSKRRGHTRYYQWFCWKDKTSDWFKHKLEINISHQHELLTTDI